MRMRLGLLRESNPPDKPSTKEAEPEDRTGSRQEISKTGKERQSTERSDSKDRTTSQKTKDTKDSRSKSVRIRPLSEAKAIDTGANFISETFLFLVGGGLILFESWRSRRKENIRREDVAERLEKLEALDHARDVAHEKEITALQREIERLKANNVKGEGSSVCDSKHEGTAQAQTVENVPRGLSPGVQGSGDIGRSSSAKGSDGSSQTGQPNNMDSSRRPTT